MLILSEITAPTVPKISKYQCREEYDDPKKPMRNHYTSMGSFAQLASPLYLSASMPQIEPGNNSFPSSARKNAPRKLNENARC